MISTPRPLEVGVRDAGAEEQGLAGLESDVVEQHRGDDAGVARVVVGDVRRTGRARRRGGCRRPRPRRHRVGHLLGVGGEDRREDLAQGRVLGVGAQQVDVGLEGVDAEAARADRAASAGRGSRTGRRTR